MTLDAPEAIHQVREHLRTAVCRQMVADVPVGAFLSGGLDSSAVVAMAREIAPGIECFTIDTGHLVAYDDGMQVKIRKIAKGWIQSGKSGEGFVMDIQGPGRVWTQSRNAGALVDWLTQVLPFTRS